MDKIIDMIRALLLFTIVGCLGFNGVSQATLGITSTGAGWIDTTFADTPNTFIVNIKNTGDTAFIGDVSVVLALDTGGPLDIVQVDTVYSITLEADSIFSPSVTHSYPSARYSGGNNTVVIWPYAPGFGTTDTLVDTVFILAPTWINDPVLLYVDVAAYPNPSSDYVMFTLPDNAILNRLTLFSSDGRIVYFGQDSAIYIGDLTAGLYIAELILADGRAGVVRLVRE